MKDLAFVGGVLFVVGLCWSTKNKKLLAYGISIVLIAEVLMYISLDNPELVIFISLLSFPLIIDTNREREKLSFKSTSGFFFLLTGGLITVFLVLLNAERFFNNNNKIIKLSRFNEYDDKYLIISILLLLLSLILSVRQFWEKNR